MYQIYLNWCCNFLLTDFLILLLLCSSFKTLPRKAARTKKMLNWEGERGHIKESTPGPNSPAPQKVQKYISQRFQVISSALFWSSKQEYKFSISKTMPKELAKELMMLCNRLKMSVQFSPMPRWVFTLAYLAVPVKFLFSLHQLLAS
jgi:hypothetical protein